MRLSEAPTCRDLGEVQSSVEPFIPCYVHRRSKATENALWQEFFEGKFAEFGGEPKIYFDDFFGVQ